MKSRNQNLVSKKTKNQMNSKVPKSIREKLGLFYLITSFAILIGCVNVIQKDPSAVEWWFWMVFVLVLLWFLAEIAMFVSAFRKNGVRGGLEAVYLVG